MAWRRSLATGRLTAQPVGWKVVWKTATFVVAVVIGLLLAAVTTRG